jgi:hypothetical protein
MPDRSRQFEYAKDGCKPGDAFVPGVVEMQVSIIKSGSLLALPEQRIEQRRPPRELWREGLYVGPNGGCTPAGCYKVAVYRAGEGSVQISCPVRDLEE